MPKREIYDLICPNCNSTLNNHVIECVKCKHIIILNHIHQNALSQARREGAVALLNHVFSKDDLMHDYNMKWINKEYPVYPDAEQPKGEG